METHIYLVEAEHFNGGAMVAWFGEGGVATTYRVFAGGETARQIEGEVNSTSPAPLFIHRRKWNGGGACTVSGLELY